MLGNCYVINPFSNSWSFIHCGRAVHTPPTIEKKVSCHSIRQARILQLLFFFLLTFEFSCGENQGFLLRTCIAASFSQHKGFLTEFKTCCCSEFVLDDFLINISFDCATFL